MMEVMRKVFEEGKVKKIHIGKVSALLGSVLAARTLVKEWVGKGHVFYNEARGSIVLKEGFVFPVTKKKRTKVERGENNGCS